MPNNLHDVHNNVAIKRSLSPVVIGTTGVGKTGKPVDTSGFGGVEIIVSYGAITATAAVFTPSILEGDVTGTMTPVAAGDLLGSNTGAGLAATTPRTSGVSMNVTKRIGYIGDKRYVSGKVVSTVTAATLVGIDVLLTKPRFAPVAT